MRKFYLLSTLVLITICSKYSSAQDFSNKGKEFWLCFPQHVPSGANLATLSIWITSDKASTGTIRMTNGAFFATFNIPAYGIQEIQIPHSIGHISNPESFAIIQKSISIKTDPGKPPVVAYAQQWGAARSAATLLLPTNVLGKTYYATSFTQTGANQNPYIAKSQFQIIATKPNTQVRVTPRENGVLGGAFLISFPNIGDMYQFQSDFDLTGSLIESIASGSGGCLPIAVFSGSSNLTMGTSGCFTGSSYDPLFQQQYPVSTWGKNFGFIPFGDYPLGCPYRVLASEDNTSVFFDGSLVAVLNAGQIYPAAFTANPFVLTNPTSIRADKPIAVMQYASRANCSGSNYGDPDMVLLNPIEQNIKDITIFSSAQQAITHQWINILIQTPAASSFTINGAPPGGAWQPFGPLPGYSYLRELLAGPGSYRLVADSGFNAIAYGFSTNFESYAYSAGTNVIDLYQQIGVSTQYGIEPTPSVCTGAPFRFKVSLPYCADSIFWDLSFLPGPPVPPTEWSFYSTCTPGAGGPDSTTVVNGKTLYWYSLPSTYTVSTVGVFPVQMTTYSPNTDGCGNEQEINFDLTVSSPPIADFNWDPFTCVAEPVQFHETTPQTPKPTYSWWWNFGDPASGVNNTSNLRNPTHIFSAPGTYTIRFSDITTPGCLSDTIEHQITIPDLPTATVAGTINVCLNATQPFITFTGAGGASQYTFTYNINGGAPLTATTAVGSPTVSIPVPTTALGTFQYNLVSVQITGSTLCTQAQTGSATVNVQPDATINLTSAASTNAQTVCINTAITDITYAIGGGGSGGTIAGLPTGVNGTYSGGVFTINGTPTVTGTFNYTVNTTGICNQVTASGSITVTANATVGLTSSAGSDAQILCINTAIVPITYSVAGGGTGGNVTGLPAGVTGVYSGGVITISGTPTVSGTFNYTVNTTGTCVQATASGSITVNPNGSLNLTSPASTTNQTVCINTPITNITYSLGGAATTAVATGLPAGVTGSVSGSVFTITGTPTVTGTFNFTVTPNGTCGSNPSNGTITVNPDASISLTSGAATTNQTVCINTAITSITYSVGGGATGGTVTGLPAGVNGVYSGGVVTISGTPSASGTFNYTVNTTGNCLQTNLGGTITVNPNSTLNLTSGAPTTNQTICINTAITNITYAFGGAATTAVVTGLPAGVTGSVSGTTVTITGTPTVAGIFNYTVTPNGTCGIVPATGTITVNADASITLTSSASSSNQSVCINTAIINITYAVAGGGTGAAVTGLPTGVTSSFSAGVLTITGTPSVNGTFNYTVNTTGICIQTTATGTLTVTPNATLNLTSGASTAAQTICINTAITNITYSVAGSGTGGSATGLPAGVTGNYSGGVFTISGTPTVSGVFNYTVNTTGSCGNATGNGSITVNADATINLTSAASTNAQQLCANASLTNITYAIGGGGTGATVSGLPAGVTGSFSAGVFTISGTPSVNGVFNYTVTTTGPCVKPVANGTITVNAAPTSAFSVVSPTCETRVISFTDNSVPNAGALNGWSWNFGDPGSGVNNTSTLQNPTHTFATTGIYTVTLTVTTNNGCSSTQAQQQVTINKLPTAAFTTPTICSSDPFGQFNDNSTITPGSVTGWQWNFGDPPSGAANTSTLQNPTHTYVNPGNYNIQLIATSNAGCTDTLTKPMVVNGAVTNASYNLQNTGNICSNQSISLIDNSTVNFGSLVRLEIYWDYLNDPTIRTTDATPLAGEIYTHAYPEFGAPLTQTKRIRYIAYSGTNCLMTFDRDITIHATPTLVFNAIPAICSDAPAFQITQASITNGLPGGPGVFTGPGVSSSGFFTPLIAGGGDHTIRYSYTGANGCINFKEQILTVYPAPPVNAGPDKVVLEGGQVTLTPALNASMPVTYLWTPATAIQNPTVAMAVVVSPPFDMTYTLTVTTDKGCKGTDNVFVKLLKAPLIPNIFSPNGDGIHDRWEIAFLESYPGCTIDIYNRYGQLVYHSVGYDKPWDGTVSGKPVPVGTYYYIVNPKNGRQQYSGYVDVIR